ncbi:unnamed protein product [Colias eurytheme]|nr:unnamed protein product [Colias eurytheme]
MADCRSNTEPAHDSAFIHLPFFEKLRVRLEFLITTPGSWIILWEERKRGNIALIEYRQFRQTRCTCALRGCRSAESITVLTIEHTQCHWANGTKTERLHTKLHTHILCVGT